MKKHTITLSELDKNTTYSVKDNSPRGCHTVYADELKIGDEIVINNYFHEIVAETAEENAVETVRTREDIIEDIIEYFENNDDTFTRCIEDLDSYNGYLGDDRYYDMDMIADFYSGTDPVELLNRAYFGYDADNWHADSRGERVHDAFNPNREYFCYNGYGNLVSSDYKDYSAHLDTYAVEAMVENRQYIDSIEDDPELSALFDELEGGEE